MHKGSSYTEEYLSMKQRKKVLGEAFRFLKRQDIKTPFDAIAFQGNSGATLASPLAYLLNKELILVRKEKELEIGSCHSSDILEGNADIKSFIIVDDLVSSGKTRDRILKACKRYLPEAEYIGLLPVNGFKYSYNFRENGDTEPKLLQEKVESFNKGDI